PALDRKRRDHGVVTYRAPLLISPRGLSGPPGKMYLPPGAGTSSKQADYAQGYLSSVAANEARKRYQSLAGDMPWVPTSDNQIGDWARQQAALFNSGAIQTGINQGEQAMLQNLGIKGGEFFAPLT